MLNLLAKYHWNITFYKNILLCLVSPYKTQTSATFKVHVISYRISFHLFVFLKEILDAGGDFLILRNEGHEASHRSERKAGMTVCSGFLPLLKKQKRHGSREFEKIVLHLE